MWWCCGKVNKSAPGCKISKHECKEDEADGDDNEENEQVQQSFLTFQDHLNITCMCCKQKGHQADNCVKDPNFRKDQDVKNEWMRVLRLGGGEIKETYDDTKLTFQLLAYCTQNRYSQHPFAEGSMKFDDFNYKYYNTIIKNPDARK